uniref:Anti-sigma factor antagonist n=1 Tax=Desulfatirhabdium butyrativorans TaxID=340467 RepID=A0A7C4MKM3_9BACT
MFAILLPTAHCPLPTAHCPLPTAHCPLPTAHCPLSKGGDTMAAFEIQEEADHTVLHVRGEATIQNASEAFEALKTCYATGRRLVLDLQEVSATDVSFLQLICSLHRSCVRDGRFLTIAAAVSDAFASAMAAAGYLRLKGCSFAGSAPCLWQGREKP